MSSGSRAGAGILPYPESEGHDLQINTFKYYWALAHRDPTTGVQVCSQEVLLIILSPN